MTTQNPSPCAAVPVVSLCVGVYNGERHLAEMLDSVLAQTFADWVCVCVDDGSTDGSAGILRRYAAADARFVVLSQANAGVGAARNAAMSATETPFVMFADQDDLLAPDAMARALVAIEAAGADVLRFQSNRHDRESPFVWERVFRRSAVGDARFPPITGGEDTAFLWVLGLRGLKGAEIADELYWQRPNGESFSRAASPRYVDNVFAGFRAMAASGRRHGLSRLALFRRLFPHVFWFSLSVMTRHVSAANVRALARNLLTPDR